VGDQLDELVTVGTFTGLDEAAVARGALEQEGIETFLGNAWLEGGRGRSAAASSPAGHWS